MPFEGTGNSSRESRHDRFLRVAPGRVQKALDAMAAVAKLANAGNEFSEDEANRIIEALSQQLDDVRRRLRGGKDERRLFSFG